MARADWIGPLFSISLHTLVTICPNPGAPLVNTPLVSVLIRSIARPTLAQALESVALQDYPSLEIVLVAATPHHPSPPSHAGVHPIQFRPTTEPVHRSRAANLGLQQARGSYCLILDDDDWIAPEHISSLVKAIQSQPGYLLAYTSAHAVNTQGCSKEISVKAQPPDTVRLLSGNSMASNTVLFHRQLWDQGCRFDEQLDLYEDWDFWLQAAERTPFLFVPITTAFYRIHLSSKVHEQLPFFGPAWQKLFAKWRCRWTEDQLSEVMKRAWEWPQDQEYKSQMTLELSQVTLELKKSQHIIQALLNSRSWRITRPMRFIGTQFLRVTLGWKLAKQAIHWLVHTLPLAPTLLRKGLRVLLREGFENLSIKIQQHHHSESDYAQWIVDNEPHANEYPRLKALSQGWANQPLVSVIMPTFNSPLNFLEIAIRSVQDQVYPHWELCIADDASTDHAVQQLLRKFAAADPRIKLVLRERNGHISASSNSALALAVGEWVALLDHDDALHPLALFWLVHKLQDYPHAQVVFSDEDKVDAQGVRFGPYFKTDYNPELMWAQNMISHLGCYRKTTLDEMGGFRTGFEGSQDYDLALRVIQRSIPSQIVHIPRVLYHWRAITGSTALAPSAKPYAEIASREALKEHLAAIHMPAQVSASPEVASMNRVKPILNQPYPLISILIPTKDRIDMLTQCIESIQAHSSYQHYEILVVNNNSEQPESHAYFDKIKGQGIQVLDFAKPFNFSAINNFAARQAKGEYLCLMNNDIEIQSPDWMEEMLSFAQLGQVGAVGARLWYPGTRGLQHGGVIVGLGGVAGHAHVGLAKTEKGYFGRPVLHHRCSAVTAACLMIKKSTYFVVGGLDEGLAVAFNDVDFCLRLGQAGFHCTYTPHAEMTHHESASRGDDLAEENRQRFMDEEAFMKTRWGAQLLADPFYSPNLSLNHSDFRIAVRSRVA